MCVRRLSAERVSNTSQGLMHGTKTLDISKFPRITSSDLYFISNRYDRMGWVQWVLGISLFPCNLQMRPSLRGTVRVDFSSE
jgi:hypothetical protein